MTAIERSVWVYFSGRVEQKGMDLLTEVLQRDIEIDIEIKDALR